MEGVFLHILADTLGSVGVIISTLFIQTFGWNIADPICSLFIAILIFVSVLPLVKETALILLLRTPEELQRPLAGVFHKLFSVDGVLSYSEEHFWRHSSRVLCGTIHVQIEPDASEQKVVAQVTSLFKEAGISNMCIEVEKRTYFHHLQGLGFGADRLRMMTHGFKALAQDNFDRTGFISDL
jgi:zinc transporter 5/7